jgi:hypothetical protein
MDAPGGATVDPPQCNAQLFRNLTRKEENMAMGKLICEKMVNGEIMLLNVTKAAGVVPTLVKTTSEVGSRTDISRRSRRARCSPRMLPACRLQVPTR